MTRSISKKAMAAILAAVLMSGAVSVGEGLPIQVSVSASAASATITSGDLDLYQKEWKAHGWVLKRGFYRNSTATGKKCVKNAQTLLNFVMGENLDVDGVFGSETQRVTKNFQKKNGLSVDGIIGTQTWEKLMSVARSKIGSTREESSAASSCGYDAESVIEAALKQVGKTGKQLGYNVPWCAYYVSDLLIDAGVKISRSANPRDLTISATNKELGAFYCFRDKNLTSLKNNGISKTGLKHVVSTTRDKVTPQRGDIVIFLWSSDDDGTTNWSHVGIVTGYNSKTGVISTVEGNTSGGKVAERSRNYDGSVVGILRL